MNEINIIFTKTMTFIKFINGSQMIDFKTNNQIIKRS